MNTLTRYEGDLPTRTTTLARMDPAELRREAMRAANERDAETLWRILEAYLVTKGRKRSNISPATLESYRIGLERLLAHWQGENLLRPSRNAGDTYVVELQTGKHGDRPLDPGTIQVRLAAARAFYRALRWTGATETAPFADVQAPGSETAEEERRTAYEEEAITKLLDVAGGLERVIVLLGTDAGLRAAEMLELRWSDVNFAAGTIRVRAGKGRKRRTAEASADLIDALNAWKAETTGERVFPFRTAAAARLRLRKVCKRAGVQYLGLHSLRHSCGTWLAANSPRGIEDARVQLGHANISTTTTYAKMDRRTLKEAMKRRHRVLEGQPAA